MLASNDRSIKKLTHSAIVSFRNSLLMTFKNYLTKLWKSMRVIISFLIFLSLKLVARLFYRFEVTWLGGEKENFDRVRLIVFLNHTSLFEPLYLGILPVSFLWRLARKFVAPGASKTLDRPVVGIFWKLLSPGMIAISRKRDSTWSKFIKAIEDRSVIVIAPEGRMKRATGLDLDGKKMTVRSGVADILELIDEGRVIFAYSGGLHHIQIPGQKFPKLFKTIRMNIESFEIPAYKNKFEGSGVPWKKRVIADLQWRLENKTPHSEFVYPMKQDDSDEQPHSRHNNSVNS